MTSWTHCGDSSWCFVRSGTGCLDVGPCLECWLMWQHDSFDTTWNWMINTQLWYAVSAMWFTPAWHLTHQHIQLTSNVNFRNHSWQDNANTLPILKVYGGLCAHHNSFNPNKCCKALPYPTHAMSHKPTCQIMNPPNSQTTIRHMSITCCFMCSCAPTDHRLGRAHTFWSKINTYDQIQRLSFMRWCHKQTQMVLEWVGLE